MKVLLKQDVKKVGKRGEVITVSDGYGANYLIPNKLAVLLTNDALKEYEIELQKEKELDQKNKENAIILANKLKDITLTFFASKGRNGNMIGTISFTKIIDKLLKDYSIKITKGMITDKDLIINGFGLTKVNCELYKGVKAQINVFVENKEKENG